MRRVIVFPVAAACGGSGGVTPRCSGVGPVVVALAPAPRAGTPRPRPLPHPALGQHLPAGAVGPAFDDRPEPTTPGGPPAINGPAEPPSAPTRRRRDPTPGGRALADPVGPRRG